MTMRRVIGVWLFLALVAVPAAAHPDRVMRVVAGRVVADDLPASSVVEVGAS